MFKYIKAAWDRLTKLDEEHLAAAVAAVTGQPPKAKQTPTATIGKAKDGKFELLTDSGAVFTYTRKRDAVRGAERLGYVLV